MTGVHEDEEELGILVVGYQIVDPKKVDYKNVPASFFFSFGLSILLTLHGNGHWSSATSEIRSKLYVEMIFGFHVHD